MPIRSPSETPRETFSNNGFISKALANLFDIHNIARHGRRAYLSTMKVTDREYALDLDSRDPLAQFRSQFVISDPNICYLDGNSLGRLPLSTVKAVNDLMTNEWGPEVVTGWSHWVDEAQPTGDLIGRATLGAGPGQVLACDTTSVNFYQLALAAIHARPGRKTIITDAANFPTDRYILDGIARAIRSQARNY
jgi:kynureninase